MNTVTTSVLVTACVFAGGLVGLQLHRVLPPAHLTKETQDVVRLGTGMVSVLASLVLGLLIATAKSSYDTSDHSLRAYAAELALLNETLRDYGAGAAHARDALREYTARVLHDRWPTNGDQVLILQDPGAGAMLEHAREAIRDLRPGDAGQTWLKSQALDISVTLLRQRFLLIEEEQPTVRGIVLVILVSWIVAIFVSFGLNAPRNGTVVIAFLICSMAIGGSVFLILEMDQPLGGVMRIPSWPIENVLASMKW
ncbi:MAG TPA: hypothetical protein VFW75_08665 [Acetobacteraceae bacterium]|nr:hypothetical protein [Acetobacteraceae bacterium]